MENRNLMKFILLSILVIITSSLYSEDKRTIPLDMYLIIDDSASLQNAKNDAIAWLNNQVVDRILTEGDKITIWTAGEKAQVIYSDTISGTAGKNAIKEKFKTIQAAGKSADFSGALHDLGSRVSGTPQNRLAYSMLIIGSAEELEPAIAGSAQGLLRWFRSEKYERWQVLIVAPDIGRKVQQAGAAYMNSIR